MAHAGTLLSGEGLTVLDYRCTAESHAAPEDEEHGRACIALVVSGSFVYRSSRGTRLLVPGSVLLGNERDPYRCTHETGGGDRCLSFELSEERLAEVAGGRRHRFAAASLPLSPRIAGISARLGAPGAPDAEEIALLVADAALREAEQETRTSPRREDRRAADLERVHAAAAFLDARHAGTVRLADVAAHTGTSPFHFLRLFQAHTGLTPHQFLVRTRLKHAAARLARTASSVTDVAYSSGFADLSNFVRTFHRVVGLPPRAFRKILQVRGAAEP